MPNKPDPVMRWLKIIGAILGIIVIVGGAGATIAKRWYVAPIQEENSFKEVNARIDSVETKHTADQTLTDERVQGLKDDIGEMRYEQRTMDGKMDALLDRFNVPQPPPPEPVE